MGEQSYGTIIRSSSSTSVSVSSTEMEALAGGLAGKSSGEISNSFSLGTVTASGYMAYTGGLVGRPDYCKISNCYSQSAITATSDYKLYAGGLAGYQDGITIRNCYSTGSVVGHGAGQKYLGGLAGIGELMVNSFWDTQTSGLNYSSGGRGRTTAELRQSANYVGWSSDWELNEGQDYPRLAWEGTSGTPLHEQQIGDFLPGTGINSDLTCSPEFDPSRMRG